MRLPIYVAFLAIFVVGVGCSKSSQRGRTPEAKSGMARDAAVRPAQPERRAGPMDPREILAPPRKAAPRLVQLWAATGLKVPESVLHDPVGKLLYVSCINGKPTEKNGQGFVAKLSLEGKVLVLEWAKGMDAPKGMGLAGDLLWVTDIDRIHAVDTKTGKIAQTILAPQAKFLNDIAITQNGSVYVSDSTTSQIHVVKEGKLVQVADLSAFGGANGLLVLAGDLMVGTSRGIVKLELASGKAMPIVMLKDFGMIDGLKAYGENEYLVSDWAGRTQIVGPAGLIVPILDTTAQKIQSADFEYIAQSRTLIIPTFFDNRVVAYRVEPPKEEP